LLPTTNRKYYNSSNSMILSYYLLVMATLRSRCGHYIFALWFLLLSFFLFFYLFPRLISAVADWTSSVDHIHTWCGPSANLECRSETCCTRLAGNAGPQNRQKFAIWAPSHKFVGLYLRNSGIYRQSEKAC